MMTKKKEKEINTPEKSKKEKKNKNSKNIKQDKLYKFFDFVDKYRLAIYGAVGGVLVTILVVILIWPERIAKLKDGTEPVVKIDGMTINAETLYENMKDMYSITALLDKIDNKILEEKYPETDEMNDELQSQAESYYSAYEQYYQLSKEDFLTKQGFGSEKAFIEYLRLNYRRKQYAEDYIKSQVTDKEIEDYNIGIIKNQKRRIFNINRLEKEKKDFLIRYISKENSLINLKYLYYDYFEKEEQDIDIIKKTLIKEIKYNWNKKFQEFYNTVKMFNKISN